MKKLIFILLLALTSLMQAQTVSGWFTESTQGRTNQFSQNGYIYGVTAAVAADTVGGDSSAVIYSKPFGTSASTIRNSFVNGKIMVGIVVDSSFANVEATLVTQISFDGTSWYTLETLSADTTPDVEGVKSYIATFTNVYAPYMRLAFNAGGLAIVTDGTVRFFYAIPAP